MKHHDWTLISVAALKGQFILEKGLAGFSTWDVTGDYKNTLVDSITAVLDGSSDC